MKEIPFIDNDCLLCGERNSVEFKKDIETKIIPSTGEPPIAISGLDGYFCSRCGDGFYTEESVEKFWLKLKEERNKRAIAETT